MSLERENRIKLHILTSLARSQRALTKMLEAMADICDVSGETSRRLAENIEVIGKYQRILAVKITGVSPRRVKRGIPNGPWLNREKVTGHWLDGPDFGKSGSSGSEMGQHPR
ncbi:hypothetical protein [Paenibacillus hamazuiensis]|uniref:hypothetical protein n=1 Tax=Paenibacillus hamazuiensis TaxID=2936508 RepID=UPI00200EB831|nr:hypothetical protein [Paenibacillus hamazuiensis]